MRGDVTWPRLSEKTIPLLCVVQSLFGKKLDRSSWVPSFCFFAAFKKFFQKKIQLYGLLLHTERRKSSSIFQRSVIKKSEACGDWKGHKPESANIFLFSFLQLTISKAVWLELYKTWPVGEWGSRMEGCSVNITKSQPLDRNLIVFENSTAKPLFAWRGVGIVSQRVPFKK